MVDQVFKIVVENLDKAEKLVKTLNKAGDAQEELYSSAKRFTLLNTSIAKVSDALSGIVEQRRALAQLGGIAGVTGMQFVEMGRVVAQLSGGTTALGGIFIRFGGAMTVASRQGVGALGALGAGFKAVKNAIIAGNISLKASFVSLGAVVGAVLGPIALIGVGVVALKKIWQTNIGGIQSRFLKFIGEARTAYSRFNVAIIKNLQKLGPLFNVVFTPIFQNLRFMFALVKGGVNALSIAFTPVIDVLADLGNELSILFGNGERGKGFENILMGIGKAFKFIGQVVKVAITPFVVFLKVVTKVVQMLTKVASLFKSQSNNVQSPSVVPAVTSDQRPASQSVTNSNQRIVNNNQQLTFNTNRATTPGQEQNFAALMAKTLITQ